MYANHRNFCVLKEIRVDEHDGDVRFQTRSGNMAVSCMRSASGHNYSNSSFIVDVAMEQIPRTAEHICSYYVTVISSLQLCLREHAQVRTGAW